MVSALLSALTELQEQDQQHTLYGNYSSRRYHALIGAVSRDEDNVYFVAWVNQILIRYSATYTHEESTQVDSLVMAGEDAISVYRNRYGEQSYNFYRPNDWFPNGRFLGRYGQFQPTDDADDTSIAMRGKRHDKAYALAIKATYQHQSNGLRNRWLKRCPLAYRSFRCYNTWIGSEGLYVDLDLVVLCNILYFNAQYDLGIAEEDEASIALIVKAVKNGDYLDKAWSLAAWYPFAPVILYNLADLLSTGYYPALEEIRLAVLQGLMSIKVAESKLVDRLLIDNALMKLDTEPLHYPHALPSLDEVLAASKDFSYGVIPLTHPFDGTLAQCLGSWSLFRMHYQCDAQCVAILLEHCLLTRGLKQTSEK